MKTKNESELTSDFSLIEQRIVGDGEAFERFKDNMKGRAYGREALNTAWSWFLLGWHDSMLSDCKLSRD